MTPATHLRPAPAEVRAALGAPPAHASAPGMPLRAARALIGFLSTAEAVSAMSGHRDRPGTPEQLSRIAAAREAVAARAPIELEAPADAPAPAALLRRVTMLAATEPVRTMLAQGWRPRVVDLTQVIGTRPVVFGDGGERVRHVPPDDVIGLAALTMPLPAEPELSVTFDPVGRSYVVASSDPNLRVLGTRSGADPAGVMLGFAVGVAASQLEVAVVGGRPLLRDGHHRAVALLARGVTCVPAFVRDVESVEAAELPAGALPASTLLGPRPPLLPDYLNDAVSAGVRLPATQKVVLIQAVELETLG